MIRIPQVTSIETATWLYYERIILRNPDIIVLFGKLGRSKIVSLKNLAFEEMKKRNCPVWNATAVNTEAAYAAWGLDIADLEKRYEKLQKYGKVTLWN